MTATWLGDKQDPVDTDGTTSNPGVDDRFTCPGCYNELGGRAGDIVQCDDCCAVVRLYVEMHPSACSSMIHVDDAEDYEDELDALDFHVANRPKEDAA